MKITTDFKDIEVPSIFKNQFTEKAVKLNNSDTRNRFNNWGFFNVWGSYGEYAYGCHHPLIYGVRSDTTHIFNVFTGSCSPEWKRFAEYLISPDSCYGQLFDDDCTLLVDDKSGHAVAIEFKNVNKKPIQLMMNFFICSRFEKHWKLAVPWSHFVDMGMSPECAHILAYFTARSTDKLFFQNPAVGDQPFNIYIQPVPSRPMFNRKTFFSKKPFLNEKESLAEGGVSSPNNLIWREGKPIVADSDIFAPKLLELFYPSFGRQYKNSTPTGDFKLSQFTEEHAKTVETFLRDV